MSKSFSSPGSGQIHNVTIINLPIKILYIGLLGEIICFIVEH